MQIASHMEWSAWAGNSLAEAHVQRRLPARHAAPSLQDLPLLATREPMDMGFLEDLRRVMDPDAARRFGPFEEPRALAVVTGQQPGCAGGAALVLLKAATAVALARRAAASWARPVVPLFWNGTDDVDFDEIARVAWPGPRGELLFLELPAAGRRPQGLVGDLPAAGDEATSRAALQLLGAPERQALEALLPRSARDHGTWVAKLLMAIFPELAVVDARNVALRRHAARLYGRYLDVEAEVPSWVTTRARELEAAGFRRTLGEESLRRGLFVVEDGQRQKVNGEAGTLRRTLEESPETLAPNVLLRALVQDSLFPVVASVVGPAEVGYLHELQPLRQALRVPSSALVPRLSLTWFDGAGWKILERLRIAPEELLRDPEEALRRHVGQRLRASLEPTRASFVALEARIEALAPGQEDAGWKVRGLRRLRALQEELERDMESEALQELLEDHPPLRHLRQVLRPRGRPQERLLAGLFLAARWGEATGDHLVQLAETHLDALEQGRLRHWLVVD